MQRMGRTRTAMQRRAELADVDLDKNDKICFIEYLLLHYKVWDDTCPTYNVATNSENPVGAGVFRL